MTSAGPAAGSRPEGDVAFLRLLVEAPGADAAEVARVAGEALGVDWRGAPWSAAPMFAAAVAEGDATLGSFFELTGAVDAFRLEPIAWEVTYRLRDTGRLASVRPDLPTGTYQLDEAAADDGSAPGSEAEGIFGGSERDLPETDAPNYTWALDAIRARQAWDAEPAPGGSRRGLGSVVGHPDTGYTVHPQVSLAALDLDRDRDFVADPEDDDAMDPLDRASFPMETFPAHGTGTGSVIAGRGEGALTGVAPEATIIPIRAVRSVIQFCDGTVAKAVDHARRVGAHVISMSLGGIGFRGLEAAIDRAVADGVIVIAAAGNYLPGRFVCNPARYPACLAIAASDARDGTWKGSSRGRAVDVAAPGTGVWVARWDLDARPPVPAGIGRSRGTSHATAHVAGVAALWLAHHGRPALIDRYGAANLSAVFRHLVRATSRQPAGWDRRQWGAGIVDAASLLAAALPDPAEVGGGEEVVEAGLSPMGVVLEAVPDVDDDVLRRRLATVLGRGGDDEAAVAVHAAPALDRYADELAYLVLERREVREALAGDWEAEGVAAGPVALRRALARNASRSLGREVTSP